MRQTVRTEVGRTGTTVGTGGTPVAGRPGWPRDAPSEAEPADGSAGAVPGGADPAASGEEDEALDPWPRP